MAVGLLATATMACASSSSRPTHGPQASPSPANIPVAAVHCRRPALDRFRERTLGIVETDAWLTNGHATTELVLLRKTVVQVVDHFYDPQRIDAPRALHEMLAALARHSDGALRLEGDSIVTTSGERWSAGEPASIWEVPLAIRNLMQFLLDRLPADHRLVRGVFAEVVMVNAMLGTLDANSVLLTPAASRALSGQTSLVSDGLRSPIVPAPPEAVPLAPETVARLRREGIIYLYLPYLVKPLVENVRSLLRAPAPAGSAGLILDLRGSAGGPLDAVVEFADLFLSSGTVVTVKGAKTEEPKTAHDDGSVSERSKLVVLIDSHTAAGAEIVAGSLRFGGRALLLGASTFGAGTIQVLYDFKDRSTSDVTVLKLSVAEAVLPGNRRFEGAGIAPDLRVAPIGFQIDAAAAGCAPVGEEVGTVRREGRDAAVLVAADVLTRAASATRSNLLEVAKAIAQAPGSP